MRLLGQRSDKLPRDLDRRVDKETTLLLSSVIGSIPWDFGGGSGLPKARMFAALIHKYGLRAFLEIGVYRGRSLLPVAALFNRLGMVSPRASIPIASRPRSSTIRNCSRRKLRTASHPGTVKWTGKRFISK